MALLVALIHCTTPNGMLETTFNESNVCNDLIVESHFSKGRTKKVSGKPR